MYSLSNKVKNELQNLSKKYKVRLLFVKKGSKHSGYAGYFAYTKTIRIYLNKMHNKDHVINAFFHELGHHHCVNNNLWVKYHCGTKKDIKYTWLKAERFIDKWAANEMKIYYPNINYWFLYNDDDCVRWAKNFIMK